MRPRWLVIGLIVSVAINLFLVGAAAGVIALGARIAAHRPPVRAGALFWATERLPQPDRRQMRQMLRDARAEVQADADRSIALRTAAWDALNTPNPDAAAINAKLAESRQADIGIRARVEQRLVDYAVRLPPADRAIFAAGMRRALTPRAPGNATPTVGQAGAAASARATPSSNSSR